MGTEKHTETPWEAYNAAGFTFISAVADGGLGCVATLEDRTVAALADREYQEDYPTAEENVANGAYIVLACNAHDELVAACRHALAALWDGDPRRQDDCPTCMALRAAIAKAGG